MKPTRVNSVVVRCSTDEFLLRPLSTKIASQVQKLMTIFIEESKVKPQAWCEEERAASTSR